MTDLRDSCGLILDFLKTLEPSQNEVCANHTTQMRVVYQGNDFSVSTINSGSIFGIRSIVGGRQGFTTVNSTDPAVLKSMAAESQKIARLSLPNEHYQLAPATVASVKADLFDPSLVDLHPAKLLSYAQLMIDSLIKKGSVSIDSAEFFVSVSSRLLMNSAGVCQICATTHAGWSAMGMGKTDHEVTSFDYDSGGVACADAIEAEIERTMGQLRESLIGGLGARKAQSYKGMVLLHPQTVLDLLVDHVASNCDGQQQQDAMSAWKGKEGETVASSLLDIFEDPLDKSRPGGWEPFDREGIPTARHDLIKGGKLGFAAHNCFSAHRGGITPTGNAVGGPRNVPAIGFRNLTARAVANGGISDTELFNKLGKGLVLKRFSGNADPVSGQFSGIAKNSWWVEGGQKAFPTHEIMVSGNLFEILQSVLAAGAKGHRLAGDSIAPYVLVDGISVTSS